MRLADRMARIGSETAFEAAARARALEATGRSVIHLEIGEPDFDTPANVRAAAKRALDDGFDPLRAVPRHAGAARGDRRGRDGAQGVRRATADRVAVVPGGKPVMFFALLALAQEGDEVVYPDPGFPIYESMARYVGATPVPYRITQERDFRVDLDELEGLVTDRTRLLIINSPANPTGGVFTRDDIERIAELVLRHPEVTVLADEIYGRIVHDGEHVSIASLPGLADRTIVLDGFSKTYAMTGWRLGYAILPPAARRPVREADHQLRLVRLVVQPGRGDRGADRAPGRRRGDGRRVPRAARCSSSTGSTGSRASSARSRPARSTSSRGSAAPGMTGRRVRRPAARRGGRVRPRRHGVRVRRRATTSGSATRRAARTWPRRSTGSRRSWPARDLDAADERPAARPRDPRHPRRGARADPRGVRRWTSGRTSCRRRGTSCCGGSRAWTACSRCSPTASTTSCSTPPGPGLRVVSNYAVGFDNVDVPACTRRGIAVGNTPGVLTETTADLAWTLLMAAARRIPEADRYVREGRWLTWGPMTLLGPDVHGATLGIVGFGRIGQAVARRRRRLRHARPVPRRPAPARGRGGRDRRASRAARGAARRARTSCRSTST